jgi:drug/metabolite transporter (DMT)-like permease
MLWGVSDFLGGTLSRRLAAYAVIAVSEGFALLFLVVYVVAAGRVDDPLGYLPWAIGAGFAGLLGISAFYVALATGTMGVVAPIAAVGVVVPVSVGLAHGESPTSLQFLGAAATVTGVVLASGPEVRGGAKGARPIVLAFVAAGGFGAAMTCIAEGSNDSVPMTLLVMRVVTVIVLGGVAAQRRSMGGVAVRDLPALVVLGLLDVVANAAYAVATESGLVSLTSVLASLYPAVTVLLARGVHGERMRRVQDAGVGLTLLGVVLIASAGGTG